MTTPTLHRMAFVADEDDFRDIHAAVVRYQVNSRWPEKDGGGVMLGNGESDLLGAIIGEICRDWLEEHGG